MGERRVCGDQAARSQSFFGCRKNASGGTETREVTKDKSPLTDPIRGRVDGPRCRRIRMEH